MIRGHINQFSIWLFWQNQLHGAHFESMVQTTQGALWRDYWSIWKMRSEYLQCAKKDSIWIIELKVMSSWNHEKQTDFCT